MDFLKIILDKLMDLQNVNLMTGSLTLSLILRKCQVCKSIIPVAGDSMVKCWIPPKNSGNCDLVLFLTVKSGVLHLVNGLQMFVVFVPCSYVPEPDDSLVLDIAYKLYCKFNKYPDALRVALRMDNIQVCGCLCQLLEPIVTG